MKLISLYIGSKMLERAKEKAVTAKTAPRDIRGVTHGQRQLRTAANETMRSLSPYNHERKQYP